MKGHLATFGHPALPTYRGSWLSREPGSPCRLPAGAGRDRGDACRRIPRRTGSGTLLRPGQRCTFAANADPMAKGVDRALCEIVAERRQLDLDLAKAQVRSALANQRYHRDVH
ncbi:hypothetical protein FPJ79_12630 [Mycobacterium tuberculosis]|nr:hypothetical protein FPJ79_12630 [Mycobacterium tuberculosis]